jgi:hypothetical protein
MGASDHAASDPRQVGLTPVTNTFVPFGLLLAAALLAGETAPDAATARLTFSVWVTMALLAPAIALYLLPGGATRRESYRRLLWTFAYLAFLVHFYYAVFVHYGGSLREVYHEQGPLIATSNLLVTGWWGLDVVLTWWHAESPKWVRVQRAAFHGLLQVAFFMASVVIFKGFVNVLGYVLTATAVLALLARGVAWLRRASAPEKAQAPEPERRAESA